MNYENMSDFEVNKMMASMLLSYKYSINEELEQINIESNWIYPDAKGEFKPCEILHPVVISEVEGSKIKLTPPSNDCKLWAATWHDDNKHGKPAESIECKDENPNRALCLAIMELW